MSGLNNIILLRQETSAEQDAPRLDNRGLGWSCTPR